MVTPAMQLAHKIPDINVQLWATALLRDLYQTCGDGQRAQVCPVFRHSSFNSTVSIRRLVGLSETVTFVAFSQRS